MTELLDLALEAHGGLERWRKVKRITVRLTLAGYLFEIKQHPDGLRTALVQVDAQRPRTLITPFPTRGSRGLYEDGKVRIQTDAGSLVSELETPRTAYEGHQRATPWNDLQFLYFIGYAFWNYLTTPFLLASEGVVCEEGASHHENGQTWRTLRATFPEHIDTHCATQTFYFDDKVMLKRHDYFTDVAKGNAAHYCFDPRTFDGFVFPTRRRVVARDAHDHTDLGGPSSVWIELESVVVE